MNDDQPTKRETWAFLGVILGPYAAITAWSMYQDGMLWPIIRMLLFFAVVPGIPLAIFLHYWLGGDDVPNVRAHGSDEVGHGE